jgi:ATP-dependent DNA helicase RecQ
LSLHATLKTYWNYDHFRPGQEAVMNAVMEGRDTLALMPTGGGKSLCYQVPAMAGEGLCLVISPLIALMKDQVENLRKKNITAFAIYSGMSRKEVIVTLRVASNSNCKFLYVSPERLETNLFKEYLPGLGISLIAVDEAHCISQWGYDFRPPYLRIADLRAELPGVPVLALTASATPEVQLDICEKLSTKKTLADKNNPAYNPNPWKVFRQSFERPNLSYSVFQAEVKITRITEILKKLPGSGIVYCKSRRRTKEISDLLSMHGVSADFYHAGLSQENRNRKQAAWVKGEIAIIVCTNAFGMGIDKPDVRVVVHADVPDCLENYYQEAGRAGRDGKRAYAVLLYEAKDPADLLQSAQAKFPAMDEIRKVYQAIANYLQVPSHSGEGGYYDFDIRDFAKKFELPLPTVVHSLKALEQEDWLHFNEQVFVPPGVQVIADKAYLYAFEKEQPQLEPLLKALLRAYAGIFEYPVPVSETILSRLTGMGKEQLKKSLTELHHFGVIEYRPQKEKPQIFFSRNRIRAEEISLDMDAYRQRKEKHLARLRKMMDYLEEKSSCRSRFIAGYFGDDKVPDCGICDNCLSKKNSALSTVEFETIRQRIATVLTQQPFHSKQLLQQLTGINQEKAWKVLRFLEDEKRIEMDGEGVVRWVE